MNWDRMEGQWKQRRGKAIYHWGKMMNDELAAIAGKYEELVGKLQERYGLASEKSKQQVDDFRKIVEELKKSNANLKTLHAHHAGPKEARKGSRPKISLRKKAHGTRS